MSLVEYHDPDGLFPLVQPLFAARLPLRNLHWKSASRPLRSIDALHLEFVPASGSQNTNGAASGRAQEESLTGNGATSISRKVETVENGRRHQIPGMRQTPFLKLYLLRCDDKEIYKATSKKLLRQWQKESVPDTTSAQEDHDAFQWLILHVVFPQTAAADEPRWNKKEENDEAAIAKERSTKSKAWGGGSRTILERLRADFSPSSKPAPDRIAQVRLQQHTVPPSMRTLPPPGSPLSVETTQERESAWIDLMLKFKTLILASFNLRVSQYDEDIREKDSQRALPGWNFCTFFVLKEGLSKVFESVGLIEDALVGYDELAAGLETVLQDQASGAEHRNIPIATSTQELRAIMERMLSNVGGDSNGVLSSSRPLSVDRKNYRGMIVSNQISVLDFRVYIFSRQMSLLLHLGRRTPSQNGQNTGKPLSHGGGHDLSKAGSGAAILAELSERAAQSITSMARTMRDELSSMDTKLERQTQDFPATVDNIVGSWTFSAVQQVLDDTNSNLIPSPVTIREARLRPPSTRVAFPKRQSSIMVPASLREILTEEAVEDARVYFQILKTEDVEPLKHPDLAAFAAYRADLFTYQRRTLERLGEHPGLSIVNSSRIESSEDEPKRRSPSISRAFTSERLESALNSQEQFGLLYEQFSNQAAWLYALAGRKKSAEKLISDLATLKLKVGDHVAAAAYLSRLQTKHDPQQWNSMDLAILKKHAECLKALHRSEEYVRSVLEILAGSADIRRSHTRAVARLSRPELSMEGPSSGTNSENDNYFSDLVTSSLDLSNDFSAPMDKYFDIIHIDSHIRLLEDRDGFRLSLTIRQLFANSISIDVVKVRLVDGKNNSMREIWLSNEGKMQLDDEARTIELRSNTTALGEFIVDKVIIHAGKMLFISDAVPGSVAISGSRRVSALPAPRAAQRTRGRHVLCYPRAEALHARISEGEAVYDSLTGSLDVTIATGANNISAGKVIVRSAFAGVKLGKAGADIVQSGAPLASIQQVEILNLTPRAAETEATFRVPYEVKSALSELSVHLDIHYQTDKGEFIFMTDAVVMIGLPVQVNVRDIFKINFALSSFWIQPRKEIPLQLINATMETSDHLIAESVLQPFSPVMILPLQPTCMSYKISHRDAPSTTASIAERKLLKLSLKYRSVASDLIHQAVTALEREIDDSPAQELRQLVSQTFESILGQTVTAEVCEKAVLTGEISLAPFIDDPRWIKVFKGLPDEKCAELQTWRNDWYQQNSTLQLLTPDHPQYNTFHPPRTLLISHLIPHLQYLHTATLRPSRDNTSLTVPIGKPITFELRISHTRRWAKDDDHNDIPQRFTYNIQADNEQWLLSDHSCASFRAARDEVSVFELALTPLKTGNLLLPTVEVQETLEDREAGEAQTAGLKWSEEGKEKGNGKGPVCETDCTTRWMSVLVIEGGGKGNRA